MTNLSYRDITFILHFKSSYTMTEKQLDATINVPVNYCDVLGLVVPYKKLTMIVTSLHFHVLNVIEDKIYGISVKYSIVSTGSKDPRPGPKITSTPIKCQVTTISL